MKVIGIVGSPRKNENTEIILAHTLKAISEEGVETELIRLAGKDIRPCNACGACRNDKDCPIDDDFLPVFEKMKAADGIILGSPVYFGSATALIKGLIERAGFSSGSRRLFRGKVGGSIVTARRAGNNFTLGQLTFWFQIMDMIMPGSTYWNIAYGREKGEVNNDTEGMNTAWHFGKNVASLVKKMPLV